MAKQDRQTVRMDRDGQLGKSIASLVMIIHNNKQKTHYSMKIGIIRCFCVVNNIHFFLNC